MSDTIKGRGAQIHIPNKFLKSYRENDESWDMKAVKERFGTKTFLENTKNIISKNDSPDIPFTYSINPYQGCEHGCVYCYARNSHEYWGFDAALDFESKIIYKPDASKLLRKKFESRSWKPELIVLSGNTDCYQPLEKKMKITRDLLKVFLQFGNPVGIITKNVLVLRDIDILRQLARQKLVKVIFSITTLDETLRQKLEPRSAAAAKKIIAIQKLVNQGIPVSVLMGPVIPGINNHEIPSIIRRSAEAGVYDINMVMIRLNGIIGKIFKDWLHRHFPDREEKVWNQICALHQGQVNESRWGYRMRGDGKLAESIHHLFKTVKKHYFKNDIKYELSTISFRRDGSGWLFKED